MSYFAVLSIAMVVMSYVFMIGLAAASLKRCPDTTLGLSLIRVFWVRNSSEFRVRVVRETVRFAVFGCKKCLR